jgi:hypothetical protein
MKLLPIALTVACAALLIGCGRQTVTNSDVQKEEQERLADEQQAQILSAMHERQAALDEREALLNQREEQLAAATPSEPPQPQPEAPPQPVPVAVAEPATPASPDASYQTFFDDLSQYGSWVQLQGYNYVWQPLAALEDSTWRPYTLGHWVYTDDGWAWVSDEPFGWITYHYGRWMRTRTLGWVWFPGDLWAPAWVSWRYGNNFIGWAPLPPEATFNGTTPIQQWADDQYNLSAADYTFVPASEFGDDSMADVQVPLDQNGPIYDDSNNETNIYYDPGAYAIVCYGPNYEFMRSKSHRPLLPQLTLQRGGFHAGGKNSARISGNSLQVAAPRILRPRSPAAPREVHGFVADTRMITQPTPRPPPGTISQPLYTPPQTARSEPVPPIVPFPAQPNPGIAAEPRPPAATANEPPPPAGYETRVPSQPDSAAESQAEVAAQKARDAELIQQEQRQREEAAAQAAEQATRIEEQRAEQAALAARAAEEEQAIKAAREQEAVRAESTRTSQPASAPASTQAPGIQPTIPGRQQQQ